MNAEREAFEGGARLLTGLETSGLPGAEAGEVERWKPLSGRPVGAVRGLRLLVAGVPRRWPRCRVDTG